MYRCASCKKVSKPCQPQFTVVIERKEHKFPYRPEAHIFRRFGKLEVREDPGGTGLQIAAEIRVCGPCEGKLREKAEMEKAREADRIRALLI